MCQQCKQLRKNIAQRRQTGGCTSDDQELDSCMLEIFKAASRFLESTTGEGNIRLDLDRATDNLIKMYEFDAPECLIEKAHAVHRKRLRDYRAFMRSELEVKVVRPRQRRREFILVQGGRP
jgi:hypothetical protein